MRVSWIGGWGLPEHYTRGIAESVLPQAEHTVYLPTQAGMDSLDGDCDALVAYSLGTFLYLREAKKVAPQCKIVLVAPFGDFRLESGRGGKTQTTKVRFLLRWLRRDPRAALADFYHRSGLNLPAPEDLPYAVEDLSWGIEQLAETELPVAIHEEVALVGDADALLAHAPLAEEFSRLEVVSGAGHDLGDFRKELRDALS